MSRQDFHVAPENETPVVGSSEALQRHISHQEFKPLLNFLGAHDCRVHWREYRLRALTGMAPRAARSQLRAGSQFDCPQQDDAPSEASVAGGARSGFPVSQG